MEIFNYSDGEELGVVISVDTATVTVRITDVDKLQGLQVNHLVYLQSSRAGQHLIGVVRKIVRVIRDSAVAEASRLDADSLLPEENVVHVILIGTHIGKKGNEKNVFRRTLETVPEIEAKCFAIRNDNLTAFMGVISKVERNERLELGTYTLDEKAIAYLNGNKFFQRHAAVVGSTGSGKSWATASIVSQITSLPSANAIIFDLHGEYGSLKSAGIRHLRIAGPGDLDQDEGLEQGVIYLPYWLLDYQAIISMFVDRTDQNAPNQTMLMAKAIVNAKLAFLQKEEKEDVLENFTIDSPVPFFLDDVLDEIKRENIEMVMGANSKRQGPYHGKLSRLIDRLEHKKTDRRLGFLFQGHKKTDQYDWLTDLCSALAGGAQEKESAGKGVKIIDFSEVPSDILPLIVSLIARLIFLLQQWMEREKRHPIALFCDEAHLYMPNRIRDNSANEISVSIFERIAKEGRKYGVGLVVISQRPSEVNRTVLSQCNNFVAMRLTNAEDQNVVRRLLPDSLGGFSDLLPILDIGEALVVGDASLLPLRIRMAEPEKNMRPDSGTVDFWSKWLESKEIGAIPSAVDSWRKQNQQS